jgi:hypothetical protein
VRCKSLPPVSLRRTRSLPLFIADLPRLVAFTAAVSLLPSLFIAENVEESSLPMDAALAWSRQDWEREEAEQQWRLLDLAAARHHAAVAAPARGAPLIKLEHSSDDEWYRPTPSPPRLGDPGQESNRWDPGQSSQQAPPPQDCGDSSDNDDDDDYVRTHVLSLVYIFLWPNSNILRIRPIYVSTRLYILNISKFCLSLNIFRVSIFEFAYIRSFPWARR